MESSREAGCWLGVEIAGDWQQAALARDFIAALRAGGIGANELIEGRSVAEWIEWAEKRAVDSNPLVAGAPRIFEDLGRIRAWTFRG